MKKVYILTKQIINEKYYLAPDSPLRSAPYSTSYSKTFKILILHKTTYTAPSFQKKFALSTADDFINVHFLPHANEFSQWMGCAIFQINIGLLVIY